MTEILFPRTEAEIQTIVGRAKRVLVMGAGTKLSLDGDGRGSVVDTAEDDRQLSFRPSPGVQELLKAEAATGLSLYRCQGILEYDPSEFTITARAGTPLSELVDALAEQGQYFPFDPPLVAQGATLGGLVSSGISGSSRLRFGGIRDFVLGVRWVDGTGAIAVAGGKVVKNAAGFDIPKLMVGSWGRLGVMFELTLKVLPRPIARCTLRLEPASWSQTLRELEGLSRLPLEFEAIDIDESRAILVRLGGYPQTLSAAVARIHQELGRVGEVFMDEQELRWWSPLLDWSWAGDGHALVRVPIPLSGIAPLEELATRLKVRIRYGAAGNVAWLAWPDSLPFEELDRLLQRWRWVGRVVRGRESQRRLWGMREVNAFAERVHRGLDPYQRFLALD
jgi:glycolate oxidase FAD binding subunit